ncbi:hypothetical protein OESDEN_17301 [Oesophagostomum dentatum]|uniref:Uncharacterized protein n=1 Tax=Oesophagostomum dentatum TaxID=61180 RepID=A0A0B1SDK1_OESDE|nr:hypothetical protein OESDEN_17301 [Oesophagostomum dentatum]
MLVLQLAERGLRLGLVVDLTDTDRYYDKDEIEGLCIQYQKINCPGRGKFVGALNKNVTAFERARGYPIEKGSYVQALHKAAIDSRNKRLLKAFKQ